MKLSRRSILSMLGLAPLLAACAKREPAAPVDGLMQDSENWFPAHQPVRYGRSPGMVALADVREMQGLHAYWGGDVS
jgi:hypothetical protein